MATTAELEAGIKEAIAALEQGVTPFGLLSRLRGLAGVHAPEVVNNNPKPLWDEQFVQPIANNQAAMDRHLEVTLNSEGVPIATNVIQKPCCGQTS